MNIEITLKDARKEIERDPLSIFSQKILDILCVEPSITVIEYILQFCPHFLKIGKLLKVKSILNEFSNNPDNRIKEFIPECINDNGSISIVKTKEFVEKNFDVIEK